MKTQLQKIVITLALTVFVAMPIFVSAAPSAGIKPTSVFYFLDTISERVSLFFTFNIEKRVKKALAYADERLAEVEAVAEENDPDALNIAITNYEGNVALATEKSKEIGEKDKAETLFNIIADNTSKHQEVLAEIYNKAPDEAKKAIEKAIEVSIKGHEDALKEIQRLKKTVEELQKDIESLKQQGQSGQSKEIEALRKEVETLKSRQSSQSGKPQVIEKVVEKIVEVPPTVSQKSTSELSNPEIIEKVKPAIVYIQTNDGSGSGMIIESNGYVLTNAHVVSGFSTAKIKLSDERLFIGSVVGRDEKIDLALLKIQADNLSTVVLGDSSTNALKQGDEVFTLGYPFGLEEDVSFKEGTISRRISDDDTTYLETSAEIHPGNSGGPLVNKYGEVVGINTANYGKSINGIAVGETIKLAIPINLARGLIQELKSGRSVVLPKIAEPISSPIPLPSPTPIPSPSPQQPPVTTQQVETLEITSVGVVPDVISARIEWQTNKPTSAKVFISGGGLSSKVYNSESGLSTRHVANIAGLISNTSYSYEIESISDNQVVKEHGSFSTKTGELTIEADKTSIQFINGHSIGDIRVTAKYTENGKIVVPVDISFSAPDDSKTYRITELSIRPCSSYHPFHIQLIGSTGGSCTADANVTFSYAPKSLGTHTISVTAKGITKSVNIQVTEYEIVDPTIEVLPMHVDGVVMSIPIFDLGNHYGTVGRFKILPEESYSDVTDKQYESDAPHAEYLLWLDPRGNGEYGFKVSAQFIDGTNNTVYKLPTGTYTIVLKGLRVLEKNLGQYRNVSGLPVTFTFKVVGQYP